MKWTGGDDWFVFACKVIFVAALVGLLMRALLGCDVEVDLRPDATPGECGEPSQRCCPVVDPAEDMPCGRTGGACVDGYCAPKDASP